jgi:hypothetical protein
MKYISLLGLLVFLFTACQKEIKVNLNEADPRVVIEANYNATDSLVTVKVTKTVSFFDAYDEQLVASALITIKDENGNESLVPFVGDGMYVLQGLAPVMGATYTLKVVVDGVSYESKSKLMPTLQLLPSKLEFQQASFFQEEGYQIYFRFQDFPGLGNCYKLIPTYDGVRYDKFQEYSMGNDKLTDGNLVERPLFDKFQLGDTVILEMQSINEAIYNYYHQLSSSTSAFNAAVGNPDYLWTNKALGYFSAYTYSLDTVYVE